MSQFTCLHKAARSLRLAELQRLSCSCSTFCGSSPGAFSMPQKRTRPVDLGHDVAEDIFKMHVPLDLSPKTLWQYKVKEGSKNPGVQWMYVAKVRPLLSDILDKTGGRLVRQHIFHNQFRRFLLSKNLTWSLSDSEAPILRLRTMMSGLLKCKTGGRKPPRAYESLTSLLDKIHVSDDEGQDNVEDDVDSPAAEPQTVVDVSSSSEEDHVKGKPASIIDSAVQPEDIDELAARLFASSSPAPPLPTTPLRRQSATSPPTADKTAMPLHLLSPQELAAAVSGCQSVGPAPAAYRVMKRPAAANKGKKKRKKDTNKVKKKKEKDSKAAAAGCASPQKKMPKRAKLGKSFSTADLVAKYPVDGVDKLKAVKKRVHSKIWHAEDDRCKANGMQPSERHVVATRVAREGVQQWLAAIGF